MLYQCDETFDFFSCSSYGPENIFYLELLKKLRTFISEVISQSLKRRVFFSNHASYTREQNTTCKGHLAFQKATISLENDVHSFFPFHSLLLLLM